MAGLSSQIIAILEPYIGDTAADTCVRATAEQLGKKHDALSTADIPVIEASVRHLLDLVAPPATVDRIIDDIRQAAR